MKKYLFITYGEAGWRGVQMRALRMASHLPREQVLFWNIYDNQIIHDWGFDVEVQPPGLQDPAHISFPDGVETVIFSDLPTNELGEWCIFQAARNAGKKVVICEQIYRRGQLKEDVFRACIESSDLFLVNALSAFKREEYGSVKIVPPQIEYDPDPSIRSTVRKRLGIPADARILFGSGYNESVLAKIQELSASVERTYDDVFTVITAETDTRIRKGHTIIVPFCQGAEYYELLAACDIALVKFGFLQILEALALRKPTIVLGEAGNVLQQPGVIDPLIEEVLYLTDTIDNRVIEYVNLLLSNTPHGERLVKRISMLHDGTLYGAREAAMHIENLSAPLPHPAGTKRLAILINEEMAMRETLTQHYPGLYVLSIAAAMPTDRAIIKRFPDEVADYEICSLQTEQPGQILPHSFTELMVLSKRKFDGFTDIMPWFSDWIDHLKTLLAGADELHVSQRGITLLGPLIQQVAPHLSLHILELPTAEHEAIRIDHHTYV